jgi:hypothetical protein
MVGATDTDKRQLQMLSKRFSEANRRQNPSLTTMTTAMTTITKFNLLRNLCSLIGLFYHMFPIIWVSDSFFCGHGKRGVVGFRPSTIQIGIPYISTVTTPLTEGPVLVLRFYTLHVLPRSFAEN